jgi:hypothetical protein
MGRVMCVSLDVLAAERAFAGLGDRWSLQERLRFAGEGGTTLRADYRYSEAPCHETTYRGAGR